MADTDLTVAVVLKPQGIRGEIKVKVMCDSAEDLADFSRVFIGGEEYKILKVRGQGDCAYLTLKGIADRNAAELLRGKDVIARREDAPELPDDRFYIVDVLGCAVVDGEGNSIGKIVDITPARTDIFEVDMGGKKVPFAAIPGVILNIDVDKKVMTVDRKKFNEAALLD